MTHRSLQRMTMIAVLALGGSGLHAQVDTTIAPSTAQDFFNSASKQYVKERKSEALKTLDKGLKRYPGDPRLLKLAEELVKEEQDQQKDQQQRKQDEQKQKEEEQKQKEQQQAQQKEQERTEPGEPQPGRIAPQDAKRILDALDREEKAVQAKARAKQRPAARRNIDKDW